MRPLRAVGTALLVAILGAVLWWLVFVVQAGPLWSGAAALGELGTARTSPDLLERALAELSVGTPGDQTDRDAGSAERFLWDALSDRDPATRLERFAAAVAAAPEDPAVRAAAFTWELDAAVRDPSRLPQLREAAEEGARHDPENALYPLGVAIALLEGAGTETPAPPSQAEAQGLLLAAAGLPRLQFHLERTNRLALARRLGLPLRGWDRVFALRVARGAPYHWPLYNALTGLAAEAAARFADAPEEAEATWAAVVTLSLRYQERSRLLVDLLTGLAIESWVRQARADTWLAAGRAQAAARELRVIAALEELERDVQTLKREELGNIGTVDRQLVPVGGWSGSSVYGRRLEYRTATVLALGLLGAALVLWSALFAGLRAWRSELPVRLPRRALWLLLVYGVLAPVAGYLFFDNFHPSRQVALFSQRAVLVQPLVLACAVPLLLALGARGLLGRADEPGAGRARLSLGLLGFGSFVALFWTGNADRLLAWNAPASIALASLLGAGLCALDAGLVAWRRLDAEARTTRAGAVFRASALGFLLVLALTAGVGLPVYWRAERDYLERVILPLSDGEVGATRWRALRDLDREAIAEPPR